MLKSMTRFRADRRGNFAVVSALVCVPLLLGAGLALDTSNLSRIKSDLQHATDSAALAIVREGVDVTDTRANEIAQQFLSGNFDMTLKALEVQRTSTGFSVQAKATPKLTFGTLFGYADWTVGAKATADIADIQYEIGLVLDTTGSMAGGKLASMKDAVTGLVDTLSDNVKNPANLKFAMVPFANLVNVGPQFAPTFNNKGKVNDKTGAFWLDRKGKSTTAQRELKGISRFEVFHNLGEDWAGCVETRQPTKKGAYDVTDLPPTDNPETLFVPALSIDEPDTADFGNSYIASSVDPLDDTLVSQVRKISKYGLVGNVLGVVLNSDNSGTGNNNTDATTSWVPVSSTVTEKKGPNASCTSQPISPLSADYNGLKKKVDALEAGGNTNIMEGVAWGWRVLSPGEPFTEGRRKSDKVKKVMIVLTDGSNTFGIRDNELGSSYTSFGFAVDNRLAPAVGSESGANSAMNAKTLQTCTNAKADGIEIFTIRLEEPNVTTGMMLKDCATDEAHFFDAPSRSQLDEVFAKIGTQLAAIRLSS